MVVLEKRRKNNEVFDLYKYPDIISSIRISRSKWARYVKRIEENEIPKRVGEYKFEGRRRIGQPRLR